MGAETFDFGEVLFAFDTEFGELSAFEDFDDEVSAGLEIALGDFEGATGDVDGADVVGGLVSHGWVHHVGEDDIKGLVAHEGGDFVGGIVGKGIAGDGVDAGVPEFILSTDGEEVYADDDSAGLFGAEILASDLKPGPGGAAEVEDAVALFDEFAFVLDFGEFVG